MLKKPPRRVDSGTLNALASLVSQNEYRIIANPELLPSELANYAGTNYLCSVIAGTNFIQDSDSQYASNGDVWWVKTFRNCYHNGTRHYNADMRIYYTGIDAQSWMVSSKQNPDHYIEALYGTNLVDARIAAKLPESNVGELSQLGFQSHELNVDGEWPDFEMPYWNSND